MNKFTLLVRLFPLLALLFFANSCEQEPATALVTESKDSEKVQLFKRLPTEQTGIDFNNKITENINVNFFVYDAVYQGSGLAIGDVNNDGLDDVFFSGNMVAEKLYLNEGQLKFKDITATAGIALQGEWSTGVTMADVNGDGWLDIYICNFLFDDHNQRRNKLYINNHDLTFTESAKQYGIDDAGLSIAASFFDYDKDGDLDLYLCNQPPNSKALKKEMAGKKNMVYTDRLYQNNGDGTFTDATDKSGIANYAYSLSATISDLDQDGWPDIYVACDYEEPDYLFHNNGNGTFTNIAHSNLQHMSNFSMGADIADINNDGWADVFVADMVAADNSRLKTNMSGMNPRRFWQSVESGLHYQYMFNTLQLNNGNGTFSDIAQLAGVSNTDWSWSPLLVDFDNDGYRDLLVTNGIRRDMRNNDFKRKAEAYGAQKAAEGQRSVHPLELLNLAPSVKLQNYIYRNQGNLTFNKMMDNWGFADDAGWSQGAAFSDLDNDGDVDLIFNNMDEPASVYQNQAVELALNNYLRIRLQGLQKNKSGIGAKIRIYYGEDEMQMQELSPTKGFMSCSEAAAHFGLGIHAEVQRVEVEWPSGQLQMKEAVRVNQELLFDEMDAVKKAPPYAAKKGLLVEAKQAKGIGFVHQENEYDDFAKEILLPHRMSQLGPCLAKGDIDQDGLEDVFIGGAAGQVGAIYRQLSNGNFQAVSMAVLQQDKRREDAGALFFDADADQDLDLYVASGGNEFPTGSALLQDRLYLNDGKGNFAKSAALPKLTGSTAAVAAHDFDGDGDQDLFVGGRQVPGQYGYAPQSYLLLNEGGKFVDKTVELAPDLQRAGMITDALWMDIDEDKDMDLVVVGEWMPISFFKKEGNVLQSATEEYQLQDSKGWWNCLEVADLDGDGDQDLLVGNLGLNIKYKASEEAPFKVYIKDFDDNGSNDIYLGYYDADGECYPVRGRECSSQQLPFVKKEFVTYEAFSKATIEEVLGDRKEGAVYHEANIFESVLLRNDNGVYKLEVLPMEAQIAPINGFAVHDWNEDGQKDILFAGNFFHREVETTRSDAGVGQILLGNTDGDFHAMPSSETGLRANRDVRALTMLKTASSKPLVVIANNDSGVQVYE